MIGHPKKQRHTTAIYILLYSENQKTVQQEDDFKGSDRQSEVVELSMQYCAQILQDSFQTYETFIRSINPEFEHKVDVQTSSFWVDTFS